MDTSESGYSPSKRSAVPQFPVEYDDMLLEQGSFASQRDFSQDINRKMKVPDRLSVDGKNLHDLEVENMRASDLPARFASMAVPDKITLVGSGARDPLEGNLGPYGDTISGTNTYVNIATPPRVLTVDERFPVVEEDEEIFNGGRNNHVAKGANSENKMELSTSDQDTLMVEYEEVNMLPMETRLKKLEALEQQRRTREMVLYPVLALYFLFKLANWALGR